ncbi:MAG: DUF1538 domain-containing protein [Spirochaetaceae bacterium]|nr:DUF1538 domain-containing protein [Spirochaetaceae bacterium]
MGISAKFKETVFSVVPVVVIVVILGLTAAPLPKRTILDFVIGALLIIPGLSLFLQGVDIGILPAGQMVGAALTQKKSLTLLLGISFVIGFLVTIAEPDVQVLAEQFKNVNPVVAKLPLVLSIAFGVGIFVMIGLARSVFKIPLNLILIFFYIILFITAFFVSSDFLGISFDAGGATTGPMTVPFIMALGLGVARSSGQKDCFGLTGIASIGPIMSVLVYSLFIGSGSSTAVTEAAGEATRSGFLNLLLPSAGEVLLSLAPLIVMFTAFQLFLIKMPPVQRTKMIVGVVYSFVGLTLFLTGVKGGFMPAGLLLGGTLAANAAATGGWAFFVLILTGFVFGAITVCAEPAVYVLTEQVEEASGGNIRRRLILFALAFGVAAAVALSVVKVMAGFSLWFILLPGYILALVLSLVCPPLFVGIAFDSGGVASGPMTATFILSFVLGVGQEAAGKAGAGEAFGVIALVALAPLIAVQILGILYKIKNRRVSG